ncbi:MAG: UMP kinase [Gammaproteobacteria bacterium RBG_16_37_9]|nr:MAG: UMP kinase [Gammaproteobacteria bacterium RBG_16_37_9]
MNTTKKHHYRRVMLKLSGEALMGKKDYGISVQVIEDIARDIKVLVSKKIQLGIVVGAGNFFRGARLNGSKISRITGDHLGMVATMLNALAMQDVFTRLKIPVKVMSALPINGLIERYNQRDAIEYLQQGLVVIFAGGTGNPLVTTDTALCMRGIELDADLLLKATSVDGVYATDPKKNPKAKLFSHLTYDEVLKKELAVMDLAAFCLGRDHKMKLRIFNIFKKGALLRIIQGEDVGTLVE